MPETTKSFYLRPRTSCDNHRRVQVVPLLARAPFCHLNGPSQFEGAYDSSHTDPGVATLPLQVTWLRLRDIV